MYIESSDFEECKEALAAIDSFAVGIEVHTGNIEQLTDLFSFRFKLRKGIMDEAAKAARVEKK